MMPAAEPPQGGQRPSGAANEVRPGLTALSSSRPSGRSERSERRGMTCC
jgi:hypothetical protein